MELRLPAALQPGEFSTLPHLVAGVLLANSALWARGGPSGRDPKNSALQEHASPLREPVLQFRDAWSDQQRALTSAACRAGVR